MKKYMYSLIVLFIISGCKTDEKREIVKPVEEISIDTLLVEEPIEKPEIDTIIEVEKKLEKPKEVAQEPKTLTKNYLVESDIRISPIEHGTLVIEYNGNTIYIDPVGGQKAFEGFKPPNFIVITDIHGDHFNLETINAVNTSNTIIIGPKAVKEKLPTSLQNSFTTLFSGLSRGFSTSKMSLDIEGVAMYNIREEAKQYHPKGRGLGYILTVNNRRIYISGDTEDTFEMRQLKNIDIALVCMNLPYTMPVSNAASAVLEFKPKIVLPYHYRGTNGLSDVKKFKRLINTKNNNIEVILLNWYN